MGTALRMREHLGMRRCGPSAQHGAPGCARTVESRSVVHRDSSQGPAVLDLVSSEVLSMEQWHDVVHSVGRPPERDHAVPEGDGFVADLSMGSLHGSLRAAAKLMLNVCDTFGIKAHLSPCTYLVVFRRYFQ